jgi:predicted component of type VI protein secretion system
MKIWISVLLWVLAAILLYVTPGCSALKPYTASDNVDLSFGIHKNMNSDARGNTIVLPSAAKD